MLKSSFNDSNEIVLNKLNILLQKFSSFSFLSLNDLQLALQTKIFQINQFLTYSNHLKFKIFLTLLDFLLLLGNSFSSLQFLSEYLSKILNSLPSSNEIWKEIQNISSFLISLIKKIHFLSDNLSITIQINFNQQGLSLLSIFFLL